MSCYTTSYNPSDTGEVILKGSFIEFPFGLMYFDGGLDYKNHIYESSSKFLISKKVFVNELGYEIVFKDFVTRLTEAKKYFTPRLWTKYITTAHEKIQYGSVNQPFRAVGSRTKNDGFVLAFEIGEKVTIEYLNKFLINVNLILPFGRCGHKLGLII